MSKFLSKTIFFFIFFVFLSFQLSPTQARVTQTDVQQTPMTSAVSNNLNLGLDYGKIPLYFIPNEGQVNEKALYYAKARNYTLWITEGGMVFDSTRTAEKTETVGERKGSPRYERDVSRMLFIGANKNMEVSATDKAKYKVHYFIGNEESNWKTNIPTSEAVLYKEIYQNIDLKIYGVEKQIEYDWVVRPGADIDDIRVEYKGVTGTRVDGEGNLVQETKFGELVHRKPVSFQEIEGKRVEVDVGFKRIGENVFGYEVGKYDRSYVLTIDPAILVYSTYLGGNGADACSGVAVGTDGSAYVTGITRSSNFPLQDAEDPSPGVLATAFVTKFSPDGSSLEFSTYLGNSNYTSGSDIILGGHAGIVVTGSVTGTGFPVMNAYQSSWGGGSDAFLTCFKTDGSSIIYSTYFGGTLDDYGSGISKSERVLIGTPPGPYLTRDDFHITGITHSTDFPLLNARDDTLGGDSDVFVAKWQSPSTIPPSVILAYSTYLGGTSSDMGYDVDQNGLCAFVTGTTFSSDFPQVKAPEFNALDGLSDAFVTQFSEDGSSLVYSVYLGGSSGENGFGITVDNDGGAYVTGWTTSSDFPRNKAYDTSFGGYEDAFVTKVATHLVPIGHTFVLQVYFPYSTYLGGSTYDRGYGIALAPDGDVYVTGRTESSDFPRVSPYDNSLGGVADAYISKLHHGTSQELKFSTYLGGSGDDKGLSIDVDTQGDVYAVGSTESSNFPTKDPFQGTKATGEDAFVAKIEIFDYTYIYIFDGHDFNGDGASDASVFRPSNGRWYIKGVGGYVWGTTGDIPVNGDYNGDGTTDAAVWRPSNGRWYFKGIGGTIWGTSGDIPVPGNYDGDINGTTDVAVWRPSNGHWYINGLGSYVWGIASDIPVPGDYNGDGKTDVAVWRPSNGKWYIRGVTSLIWGTAGDIPVPADYNGDGKTDIAVWRPSNGKWYIRGVGDSVWGTTGDIPTPGDYNGDGTTEIAVWRPSNGKWYIKGIGGYLWGTLGDIPLVR